MGFEVFRKFPTAEDAEQIVELLEKNRIPYALEDFSHQADISFMGQNHDLKVFLKARVTDFPKMEELINSENNIKLEEVDEEHYLFEFTDEELTDVIVKPEEWSNYDYKVAQLILEKRGVSVSEEFIERIRKHRFSALKEKESYSSTWLIIGYVSAFLGGVIGFAIGLSLWLMKKKLPNGEKVYIYDERNRTHGKRITLLGFIMSVIYIAINVYFT